jgi:predicted Zn-dependent protease
LPAQLAWRPGKLQLRIVCWLAVFAVGLVLAGLSGPLLARDRALRAAYSALAAAERTGNPADALTAAAQFEAVLDTGHDDGALRRALARAYALAERPNDAIAQLEAAWRLRPDGSLVQRELALAYEQAGRFDEADTLWRAVGLRGEVLRGYADSFEQAGRLGEAAEWRARAERQER